MLKFMVNVSESTFGLPVRYDFCATRLVMLFAVDHPLPGGGNGCKFRRGRVSSLSHVILVVGSDVPGTDDSGADVMESTWEGLPAALVPGVSVALVYWTRARPLTDCTDRQSNR